MARAATTSGGLRLQGTIADGRGELPIADGRDELPDEPLAAPSRTLPSSQRGSAVYDAAMCAISMNQAAPHMPDVQGSAMGYRIIRNPAVCTRSRQE